MTHPGRILPTLLVAVAAATATFLCGAASRPPGIQPHTPTRLQWAALELQALYGNNTMTHESPLRITFVSTADGYTVKCLMQYTPDYPAAALKIERDSVEAAFKKYVETLGWPWLRLAISEHPMEKTWPGER
jgi:hypothetical protein